MIQKYHISKYFRCIIGRYNKLGLVYHSLFGGGCLVSVKLAQKLIKIMNLSRGIIPDNIINILLKRSLIIPDSSCEEDDLLFNERKKTKNIKLLRLCLSENCNMKCLYCYVPHKTRNMPFDVAEKAVIEYFNLLARGKRKGNITFFGGEPLLNWGVLKKTVLLIERLNKQYLAIGKISLVTNGTLLDIKNILFLKSHKVGISISLDGSQKAHDMARIMRNGSGSYKRVSKNIDMMCSSGYKPESLVCTIGDHNIADLINLAKYTCRLNVPLTINDAFAEPRQNVYTLTDREVVSRLKEVKIFADKYGLNIDGTWSWAFRRMTSENLLLNHCGAGGSELCVDAEGNLKPCPGFNEYYGSINDVEGALSSKIFLRFLLRKPPNLPDCRGCDIEGLCGGGCMLNASKVHKGDIYKKGQSCHIYKLMFKTLVDNFLEKAVKK